MTREEYRRAIADIGERIDPDVLADLRRIHDEQVGECAAWNEGLLCCVDLLGGAA